MPLTREPYPWEPLKSRSRRGPVREGSGVGGGELEGHTPALPVTGSA